MATLGSPDFDTTTPSAVTGPDVTAAPDAPAVFDAPAAPDTAVTADTPPAPAAPPPAGFRLTLSGFQTVVGLTAGTLSILGALLAVSGLLKAGPSKGEVVALVIEARTNAPVAGGTVEILTTANVPVATMKSNTLGRARSTVVEGPYRIRVRRPGYLAAVREIQVLPGQITEVRLRLRDTGQARRESAPGDVGGALSRTH